MNTPTLILTVKGTVVPEHIRVGPLRIKTRTYIPDPMLCYRCYDFGHTKQRCRHAPRCRNCSGSHEETTDCQAPAHCFRCGDKHGPANRSCPYYVREKEILRLQFSKNIPRAEAVKQHDAHQAGGTDYSKVSQLQQRLDNIRNEDELKKKDDLIRQLLETITLLSKRVEDLENRKKNKKREKKNKKQAAPADEPMDEGELELDYETGSEIEMESNQSSVAAVVAAAAAMMAATENKTGAIPKANAPTSSQEPEQQSQVGGAIPKTIPISFKRQLTSNDLILPAKKTTEQSLPSNAQSKPIPSQTKLIPALPKPPPQPRSQQKHSQQQNNNRK